MNSDRPTSSVPGRRAVWILLLLVLVVPSILRLALLDVPLERDEGEYAYAAQRFLHGEWLYRDIHTMKLPGTHLAYVPVLELFGETTRGVHLGLLLLTALNQGLVFVIGRRLSGPGAGLVAGLVFGLLALSPSVLGHAANTEHFVLAPALAGIWLVLRSLESPDRRGIVGAGMCFGVAILMKQHGAAFALAGLVTVVMQDRIQGRAWVHTLRATLRLAGGIVVPLVVLVGILIAGGVFEAFWFWTVEYGLRYVAGPGFSLGMFFLRHNGGAVVSASPAIWTLVLVGVVVVVLRGRKSREFTVLVPWALLAAAATSAGLYFRPHYFLLLLPVASLFVGIGVQDLANRVPRLRAGATVIAVAVVLAAATVIAHREVLFGMDREAFSRHVYGGNPFAESRSIAQSLAGLAGPDEEIAILGSEPQILFHARRRSATGYIYTYPLMEDQPFARRMQEEMVAGIEAAEPKLLVFVNLPTSWLATEESDQFVLEWAQRYWNAHYRRVGVVELGPDPPPGQRWGDHVAAPRGRAWIGVFERRPPG